MTDVETRAISLPLTSEGTRIGGYAAVFGASSHPLIGPKGVFTETISKSAFNKSKSVGWVGVRCRLEHRDAPEYLLGTTKSNLYLDVDENGLSYVVDLIPSHRYLAEQVERGIISGSSFAFDKPQDEWALRDGGMLLRTIHSCRLIDTAPVCEGAYPTADVGLRALDSFAKFVGVPVEEVRKRAEETGDLRGYLTVTKPKPGYKEPVGLKKRLDEMRTKNGRLALMETLAAKDNPVDPATYRTPPKDGKRALAETEAAKSVSGRERLLQTLDEQWPELRTSVADAMLALTMAQENPVYCVDEAPTPAPERVTETAEAITGFSASYRTLTGRDPWEALRVLDAMKPPEPRRPPLRATDAYSAESGGRF